MQKSVLEKYGHLLANYCLYLKEGETVYVKSTWLAEPLLQAFYKEALVLGAHVEFSIDFQDKDQIFYENASNHQLDRAPLFHQLGLESFDAYLHIMAPFNLLSTQSADKEKVKKHSAAYKNLLANYNSRNASGKIKRCLCLYPTAASAQSAGMSLREYEEFVFKSCFLLDEQPAEKWRDLGRGQQKIVDFLNKKTTIRYVNDKSDISFSTAGRTWINSDGKANMPSGEVYSSPVEDSVNGYVHFDFPSIYSGHEVEGISLEVKNGEVIKWTAERGAEYLDNIFSIPGAKYFGEVAIATNYGINRPTKNILFDEKMGGTVHMAIGQSYLQAGGKNQSSVHWDMIADMKRGGQIYADGSLIYENGLFLF
ncbi:MAG: aminopeptidase [Chitinophagales bacterium]|nr:aminopeptidase [Chitinophagales bacterium]